MKYPEIAKRFNYILTLRHLKARELAEKADMTEAAISHYVNGNRCPTNRTAVRLAKVLKCNPLWLMDLDENMIKDEISPAFNIDYMVTDKKLGRLIVEMQALPEKKKEYIIKLLEAAMRFDDEEGGTDNG